MTVLVGIPHNGVTWIGADSATSTGSMVRTTCDPKVWLQGDFVFASTGAVRERQLVEHRVTLPDLREGVDVLRYLVVDFADAVRQARKDGGYDEKEPRGQEAGPVLMIGYAGPKRRIEAALAAACSANPYCRPPFTTLRTS